ncbi:protein kinase [Dactylosporangium sp. NPDC000555]|uniref:protein kinase domain-containing protein n=1 Tax=Dactylosporangium sp. NPDC000555 TaxID=3154260 RepID=UPI00332B91A9
MPAAPSVVADRYRLLEPLGAGGMGRVWRARDEVLHRDVAVKQIVLPPELYDSARDVAMERTLREARAAARLNHPNVVRVYDVLAAEGQPWLVMEYVRSRSLDQVFRNDGPLEPRRVAEIGLAVLDALRAAHRAGVDHRDIKPGNVLLADDGRVVLTDFGIARVEGEGHVTRTGLVLGSPEFIAPERAREGIAGPASDLWSLGATLYTAVEGRSPFGRGSAMETLTALASEEADPPQRAGALAPALRALLRKDPKTRADFTQTEELLRRALVRGETPKRRRSWLGGWGRGDAEPITPVLPAQRAPLTQPEPATPPLKRPPAHAEPVAGPVANAAPTAEAEPAAAEPAAYAEPLTDAEPVAAVDPAAAELVAAEPTAEAEPVAAAPTTDAEPLTDAEPVGAAPIADAQPVTADLVENAEPLTEAEPVAAAPTTDAEPTAEAEPVAAAPTTDAEPTAEAEPVAAAPIADAQPVTADLVENAEPLTEAEPVAAAPTTDAEPLTDAEPVGAAPIADARPVAAAPLTEAEPVAAELVTDAAPIAQAEPIAAEPTTDARPVAAKPVEIAAPTTEAEPVAAEPATDARPVAAEPVEIAAPTTEAEPVEAEPVADARPVAAEPVAYAAPTTEAEPVEAEPIADAEPVVREAASMPAPPEPEPEPEPVGAVGAERGTVVPPAAPSREPEAGTALKTAAPGITTPEQRRRRLVLGGVGAVLVVALLVWLVVLTDGDDDPRSKGTDAAQTTAAAEVPAPTSPSAIQSSTRSASPSTAAPVDTQPSSAPPAPSTTQRNLPPLPPGWIDYHDPSGFSVYVPEGWRQSKEGRIVYFRTSGRTLGIDQSDTPNPDPVADWRAQEQSRVSKGHFRNYTQVRIEQVDYFMKAADWEFTFDGNSTRQHVNNRGVVATQNKAYGFWWQTAESDWAAAQPDLQLVFDSFRPAG